MPGLYSLSPITLFEKLKKDFTDFYADPSEEGIYDVIFPLYHLREWICPGSYEAYKNKDEDTLTREEYLHKPLHEMKEYKVVRSLCNNAKHFNPDPKHIDIDTSVLEGARYGLARCGDSYGINGLQSD